MSQAAKFTTDQLAQWSRFERVRKGGRFNMLFPEAREAARLTRDEHIFIITNYEALAKQHHEASLPQHQPGLA